MRSILPHQAWLLLQWLRNFAHTDFVTLLMSGTEHDITLQYKWIHESVKGIVHLEIKMQSSVTHPHVIPNSYHFLFLWNIKDDILKNDGNQTVSVPFDIYFLSV